MTWLAGVDGCKGGWFRVCRETSSGQLTFDVIETVERLAVTPPEPRVVALDMPIGLPSRGSRDCDVAARRCLKERRNSVFPAPIRQAVTAGSREEASRITQLIDGRKVAAQAWAIYPKIRAVDEALRSSAVARAAIREVHPEVCFWAWNGRTPMAFPKKSAQGHRERLDLVEGWLGTGILADARKSHLKKDLADDDILDAIAGLWTAHRIAEGEARTLPETPPIDERGLPMEIVY